MKDLERRLEICSRQAMALPEEIKDAQSNIDKLLENTRRIDLAMDKLESLQDILDDTDRHIDKVQRDRDGIINSEARLNKLSNAIDTKFTTLEEIAKADAPRKSVKPSSVTPKKRESAKELKRQGWRIEEIASILKLSEGEVQLILDMPE